MAAALSAAGVNEEEEEEEEEEAEEAEEEGGGGGGGGEGGSGSGRQRRRRRRRREGGGVPAIRPLLTTRSVPQKSISYALFAPPRIDLGLLSWALKKSRILRGYPRLPGPSPSTRHPEQAVRLYDATGGPSTRDISGP